MNHVRKSQEVVLVNDFLEKMDLHSFLYPLWLNKWVVGIVIAICLMIGSFQAYTKTPLYSSDLLLQLEERGNLTSFDKNSAAGSLLGSKKSSAAEIEIALIKSRFILEPVAERLHLDIVAKPIFYPYFGAWYARKHSKTLAKPWWGASRYAWGGEKIKIAEFHVPFAEEKKPFFLVAAGNQYYNLYDSQNHFILKGKVGETANANVTNRGNFSLKVSQLESGVDTHFKIVKVPIQRIVASLSNGLKISDLSQELKLSSHTGILKVSMAGSDPAFLVEVLNQIADVAVDKNSQIKAEEASKTLSFIYKQLPSIRKSLDEAETRLSKYLSERGMVNISSESRILINEMASLQKSLYTIKMNNAAALQKYTPAHPYLLALNERKKFFQNELDILHKKLSQLPSRNQTVIGLMRDVRVKNELYVILLNKIQSLEVVKGGTISDVIVLGSAILPDEPLSKNTFTILLSSALLGFLISFGIVHGNRLFNRKISDPGMIEKKFGLTNMAIIPYSDKQISLKQINHKKATVPLLAQTHPKDMSIEALRSFRTSLQFSMMGASNNIITITGLSPGVGKSFVSVNFAYLLADMGKKVLLIDGDIRKGHLKSYFNIESSNGLSEVVCGTTTLDAALISCPNAKLDFLPTGAYPPNPSELLMSERFKELIAEVSKLYDYVVIDTAPILAVTDGVVIAQHASANFMVLASNTHESKDIELALKKLDANGVKISGTVFNFSKQQKGLYRYNQISNYQYDYT